MRSRAALKPDTKRANVSDSTWQHNLDKRKLPATRDGTIEVVRYVAGDMVEEGAELIHFADAADRDDAPRQLGADLLGTKVLIAR